MVNVVAFWMIVVVTCVVTRGRVTELLLVEETVESMEEDEEEELTHAAGAEPNPAVKGWTSTTEKSIQDVVGKKLANWN